VRHGIMPTFVISTARGIALDIKEGGGGGRGGGGPSAPIRQMREKKA